MDLPSPRNALLRANAARSDVLFRSGSSGGRLQARYRTQMISWSPPVISGRFRHYSRASDRSNAGAAVLGPFGIFEERDGKLLDRLPLGELFQPIGWNSLFTVECPSKLAGNRGSRVGVLAKICRQQYRITKTGRAPHAPQSCFETVGDIASRFDLFAAPAAPRSPY